MLSCVCVPCRIRVKGRAPEKWRDARQSGVLSGQNNFLVKTESVMLLAVVAAKYLDS